MPSRDRIGVDVLGELRVRLGERVFGPRDLGGRKPKHLAYASLLAHPAQRSPGG